MAKNTIAWEKWKNPYKLLKKQNQNYDDGYDHNIDVDDDEDDDGEEKGEFPNGPTVLMFTPVGPVPLTDENDPEKLFNFWVGHTNFNITKGIRKILVKSPGVEILNIYTRYRFRVGIGKMFVPKEVINGINQTISEYFHEEQEPTSGRFSSPA